MMDNGLQPINRQFKVFGYETIDKYLEEAKGKELHQYVLILEAEINGNVESLEIIIN